MRNMQTTVTGFKCGNEDSNMYGEYISDIKQYTCKMWVPWNEVNPEDYIKNQVKQIKTENSRLTINDYQTAALRTANTSAMDNPFEKITNGSLGLCGESGEVADHLKKFKYQGHELDRDYLAKELGDICWYVALLADGIGYDLETIMQLNIEKLKKRYPEGFSINKSLYREGEE